MNRMIKRLCAASAMAAAAAFMGAVANAATVALVTINQQALFFNQINDGAKQAADKAGVKLVIFNANNQAAAQNSAIEDYIAQKVDGIVLVAIDVNGVKPAITAAKKAGIPVVAIDAHLQLLFGHLAASSARRAGHSPSPRPGLNRRCARQCGAG